MARLDDRLLNHAVHQQLDEARAALNSLSAEARHEADATTPTGVYTRAHDALDYIDGLLRAADPALVWQGLLDSILSQLSQVHAQAGQLASQPQQVGPLDQTLDGLASLAIQLAGTVRITATSAKRIEVALGKALTGTVSDLRAEVASLEADAARLEQHQREAVAEGMAAVYHSAPRPEQLRLTPHGSRGGTGSVRRRHVNWSWISRRSDRSSSHCLTRRNRRRARS